MPGWLRTAADPSRRAGKGTGPRIDHRRAARRAARLPDTLLGWVGADGFPLVTPVSALRPVENGIVLGFTRDHCPRNQAGRADCALVQRSTSSARSSASTPDG